MQNIKDIKMQELDTLKLRLIDIRSGLTIIHGSQFVWVFSVFCVFCVFYVLCGVCVCVCACMY